MRRSDGFTLVELLVAITLFAALSVLLFGALHFGTRATEAGSARLVRSGELAAVTGFLRRTLADAQPLERTTNGHTAVAFDGEPDSVRFTGLPPAWLATGGWQVIRIALERSGTDKRLMVAQQPVRNADDEAAEPARQSVLLDHVASAGFAYFGAPDEKSPPDWHDKWRDAKMLPALVRLRLRFADGRRAPDVIIAVRTAPTAWHR